MKVTKRSIRLKGTKEVRTYVAHQGWRIVAERRIYFRSEWEVKVAKYLEFLKKSFIIKEWEHEPKTFWFEKIKRGTRSYLPDFKVTRPDDSHYWIEVKGYMDRKSHTKIKRFNKYYPQEKLEIIDKKWMLLNNNLLNEKI